MIEEWYNDKAGYSNADVVAVTAPDTKSGIDATLAKGGSITGTVKDGSNADALLENASVYAYLCDDASCDSFSYAGSDYTAADGAYTISGLPTGSYKVMFRGPSSGIGSFTTDFAAEWYNDKADDSNADIVAVTAPDTKSGIDATMVKGGIITGTVTDSDGNPVEGVDVSVAKPDVSGSLMWVYTDANGKYTLSGLAAGEYKMYFNPTGSSSHSLPEWYNGKLGGYLTGFSSADVIAVTLGTTQTIDAQLEKGGSIVGTVTNDGAAFKCADVSVREVDAYCYEYEEGYEYYCYYPTIGWAVTDYQGKYTVKALATGSYKLYVSGQDSSTGDSLWQWYKGRSEGRCANKIGVTAPDATTVDVAFPVQLRQCGGSLIPALKFLLN
jgi:protocatechuate 3,4-dioxygenase beta subunit